MDSTAKPGLALALAGLLLSSCGEQDRPPVTEAPPPTRFSAADLRQLGWLEGRWRGSGGGQQPFYEEYRFLNDTLIRTASFSDSTFSDTAGSGSVYLSAGRLYHRGGSMLWEATELDSGRVRFEPRENTNSPFSWRREGPDGWSATLGPPGSEREYRMERLAARDRDGR